MDGGCEKSKGLWDEASPYRIVISRSPSPSERHAALELQGFLEEISQARLPIVSDEEPMADHEIILGKNAHLAAIDVEVDLQGLGDEGFVLRTAAPHMVLLYHRRCRDDSLEARWAAQ